MRIERLHLDGFGRYADRSFGPFESALTVIYGPNEAGKSTLLAFIRHVLFGFPLGSSSENRYMVREGATHGGRLHISMDDGVRRYRVERQRGRTAAGTVKLAEEAGAEVDAAELPGLLGHASRTLFESIFAFDLTDLESFNDTANTEIGSRLYGAGLGVSQLPDVLKSISQSRQSIFPSSGRLTGQPIAITLNELEQIEASLRSIQDQASEFARLSNELKVDEGVIHDLEERTRVVESRGAELDRLTRAWEPWIGLDSVSRRLVELPPQQDFPEDGIARLEQLAERVQESETATAKVVATRDDAEQEASREIPHAALLEHATTIESIREQRGAFNNSVGDLPPLEADARTDDAALDEDLQALGGGWTPERLNSFDLSIARRDEMERRRQEMSEADRERRDLELALRSLEANLEDAEARRQDLDRTTTPIQPGSVSASRPAASAGSRFSVPSILAAAGLILAAIGGFLGNSALLMIGGGAIVGGVVSLATMLLLTRGTEQQTSVAPTVDQGQLAEATRAVARLQERVQAATAARDAAITAQQDLDAQWRSWLTTNEFPATLTLDGAKEFLGRIELARQHAQFARERRERVAVIQQVIDHYTDLVAPVALTAGLTLDGSALAVSSAAQELAARYELARAALQRRETAVAAAEQRQREFEEQEQGLAALRDAYAALLSAAGTDDAEDFRRRASQHAERLQLEASARELTGSLKLIFGVDADLAILGQALAATSRDQLQANHQQVMERLKELGEERDQALRHETELQMHLAQLRGDDEASRLRTARAVLLEDLQLQAKEWARLSVAETLLEHARRKYEQERQPAVIARASAYFEHLSGGRYTRLYRPLEEPGFRVIERATEAQKLPDQLSRGTREQLYLALRLAAIEEFGERQERLPVVVDDVLVNFDPVRARQAAIAFGTLAEKNQVIVFTCHPEVRDLFVDAVPNTSVINLD